MSNPLILGICVLAVSLHCAFANITFDLRAVGPTAGASGKCVILPASGGTAVQLELWAQITNPAPTNNIFGVQTVLGAIVSSGAQGIVGAFSPMTFPLPFNAASIAGAQNELSVPQDTIRDLGTTSVTSTGNYPKSRKDPATGGESVVAGSTLYATNNAPAGATFHPVTNVGGIAGNNGYEFLMGFTTLDITDITGASAYASWNWKLPAFNTVVNRRALAVWTDGDGQDNTGSTQFAEMSVGSPVGVILGCPEPAAFSLFAIGTISLVGRRRTR
jgi:hypothetical protein